MDHRSVFDASVVRVAGSGETRAEDVLAVEEPLEIQVRMPGKAEWTSVSVTMRTPGQDLELAVGFLFSEGVLRSRADIADMTHWGPFSGEPRVRNIVRVSLGPAACFDAARLQRNFYATSSCGVCGKASLEAIDAMRPAGAPSGAFRIASDVLYALPARLREQQAVFDCTGGLHAAALFDRSGEILALREDVGRHNALDKLTGHALLETLDLTASGILVSGRVGFELVQKALMAGVPLLAAVTPVQSGGSACGSVRDDAGRFSAREAVQYLFRRIAHCDSRRARCGLR